MISVIVPIYNVEKYLDKCLKSIVNQTYRDLEIILVDDGSTDGSYNIALSYKEKDSRIKLFQKENGGLSSARNYGLKHIHGDYLSFVDSDDYIDSEMFEEMMKAFEEDVDIVVCGIRYHYSDERVDLFANSKAPFALTGNEIMKCFFGTNTINYSSCNKIYRSQLFCDIHFPLGKKHEDIFTIYRVFDRANKIVHVGNPYYNYVFRSGSITKQRLSMKDFDYYAAFEEINDYYKCNDELIFLVRARLLESYFTCIDKIILFDPAKEYANIFEILAEKVRRFEYSKSVQAFLPKKIKLKYRLFLFNRPIYALAIKKNTRKTKCE